MCWIGRPADRRFAFKPIITFKIAILEEDSYIIRPLLYTLTNTYYYKGKECERIELIENPSNQDPGFISIGRGYHSYSIEKIKLSPNIFKIICSIDLINTTNNKLLDKLITYNDISGEVRDMDSKGILVILKCIIPSGSPYYENSDGEIVSEFLNIEENWTINNFKF